MGDQLWKNLTPEQYKRANKSRVITILIWIMGFDLEHTMIPETEIPENIFTIPEYRRKKIGFATVAKSLAYLKENGYKIATLTCVGDNINAIALYNQMGFKVIGHLLEMHWEV